MQYFYVAPNLASNLTIIIKTACFQNQQDYLVRKKTTMFLSTQVEKVSYHFQYQSMLLP